MQITIINYLFMDQEISKLKRHILSAARVFIAAFVGSITYTLSTMPVSNTKEFLETLILSALIAGTSAVMKATQEYLSNQNK